MSLGDKVLKAAFKVETIRLSPMELADMIKKEFIDGADEVYLKKLHKTIKGGLFLSKYLVSHSERYCLKVFTWDTFYTGRAVWIEDRESSDKFYQLDKNRNYRKLRKLIYSIIK